MKAIRLTLIAVEKGACPLFYGSQTHYKFSDFYITDVNLNFSFSHIFDFCFLAYQVLS